MAKPANNWPNLLPVHILNKKSLLLVIVLALLSLSGFAQLRSYKGRIASSGDIDYRNPKQYEVGGILIAGTRFLDDDALISITGLKVGDKIMVPGDKTAKAVENLWKQELFEDVQLKITSIQGNLIFFTIELQERARLSRFSFSGVRKNEAEDIKEKIKLIRGKVVNENLINNTVTIIRKFYKEKGFLNVEVKVEQKPDTTLSNSVMLKININKGKHNKIEHINFTGNEQIKERKLHRYMKETKERHPLNVLKSSKYIEEKYNEDKVALIGKYNEKGFRDAIILRDSVYPLNKKRIAIDIQLSEGKKYYFGNVSWSGNTKYSSELLSQILGIEKGQVFNQAELNKRLSANPNGRDISSLYLDDGYLFFRVMPVETKVYGDTIDLEIRITEGIQATINRVTIRGNDKTNDKVILREIRSKPGMKFSRSDITRSIRELAQLNFFDQQKLNVNPIPHPENGTVDLEYIVAEKPSDQLELSGGFGAGRVVGTLGVVFNNFSTRNLFSKNWKSILPTGDGQKLSLRAQTNGLFYQTYSFSFAEPWLGGKKPIYSGFNVYHSVQSNGIKKGEAGRQDININGISFSLGRRLKWPDDYFVANTTLNFQQYILNNYGGFIFSKGKSYNFNLQQTVSRNSIDQPIYPKSGSVVQFSVQFTPPYSLFNDKSYQGLEPVDRYKYIEYHKWKFDAQYFVKIIGNLVMNPKMRFGFIGFYNRDIGISPFERFKVGGDGLMGYDFLTGSEIIGLRGYPNNAVIPEGSSVNVGQPIYDKFVLELRHPIVMNNSMTVFALAFAEGGNTWSSFTTFNPFNVKRSVGVGGRIFLPIFGMIGLDYGYGFDDIPGVNRVKQGQFHFTISQQLGAGF